MKIILTVHKFFPDSSAGTEVLTLDTAHELQRRGHEVTVWTARHADAPAVLFDYEYEGVPVKCYRSSSALTRSRQKGVPPSAIPGGQNIMEMEYGNIEFRDIFGAFLAKYRPDVVHSFHLSKLSASAIHAASGLSIPMFFTATDFWLICPTFQMRLEDGAICGGPDRNGINCLRHIVAQKQGPAAASVLELLPDRILDLLCKATGRSWWPEKRYSTLAAALMKRTAYLRNAVNLLERVLVPTRLMEDVLLSHGVDRSKVFYQPFGINLQHMAGVPPRRRSSVLRVGYIGTICEVKGVHLLVEALRHLPGGAPVAVSIYGNMEEFPAYATRLREMAVPDGRVTFCGTFPNKAIGAVFSELDVLVVPSLWHENTPLVVYSAQAAKTIVIATNVRGMSEVIDHEVNGLLFERGDAADLAHQIGRLIDDRMLFERLSDGSRMPKSIPCYVDELEEFYMRSIDERRISV